MSESRRIAVVTGASSGIGEATARALARDGFAVACGARRTERIEGLAEEISGYANYLDVADPESVSDFARWTEELGGASVLVNSAGGAWGQEPLAEMDEEHWRWMYEVNTLGMARMTKALLPQLRRTGGHVINLGSVAGVEAYPGGSGYNAAKFGVSAATRSLRLELLGEDVRITEVLPGLVRTEFGLVRFDGDEQRAESPYRGMEPLTGEDVAECIRWAVSLPPHVNIDRIDVMPVRQGAATTVARDE